jgi:hypothetical protein
MMNRSHRNRKVRYIKALEAEVQRAAHHETKRAREVETLRERIEQLTGLLAQYGIPTPSHSPDGTPGEAGRSISLAFVQSAFPNVYPACPGKPRGPAAVASPGGGIGHEIVDTTPHPVLLMDSTWTHTYPEDHVEALTNQSLLLGTSEKATGAQCDSGRLQGSDLAAVAMDFVLTYVFPPGRTSPSIILSLILTNPSNRIERPCLGHLHGDPTKPHDPTGHVLTVSAQLHSASFGPVCTAAPETVVPPSYRDTPADILDRLLDLAPDVCPEGEATPVQAWHYVRSQPYFAGADVQSMRRLAERLRQVVKCHG